MFNGMVISPRAVVAQKLYATIRWDGPTSLKIKHHLIQIPTDVCCAILHVYKFLLLILPITSSRKKKTWWYVVYPTWKDWFAGPHLTGSAFNLFRFISGALPSQAPIGSKQVWWEKNMWHWFACPCTRKGIFKMDDTGWGSSCSSLLWVWVPWCNNKQSRTHLRKLCICPKSVQVLVLHTSQCSLNDLENMCVIARTHLPVLSMYTGRASPKPIPSK